MNTFDRNNGVGFSEIAIVMGLNPYKTILGLWAEKRKLIEPKDLSNVEAVQLGIELEDFVARKFMKQTGFKVRREPRLFVHPKYNFIYGHIDRLVLDGKAVLECKTASLRKEKEWKDEDIPSGYIIQLNGYLGLTKRSIGYIACLVGGQRFVWKEIAFNQELYEKSVEATRIFWQENVLKNIPPLAGVGDEETLALLFSEVKNDVLPLSTEQETMLNDLIEQRQGGIEQKKLIEDDLSLLENQIKQQLGEYEQAVTGQYGISWKRQRCQPFINTKQMKDDGIYEKYEAFNHTRVLRTKLLKVQS